MAVSARMVLTPSSSELRSRGLSIPAIITEMLLAPANCWHPRCAADAEPMVQTKKTPPITATSPPKPFMPIPTIGARSTSPCASPATLRARRGRRR